MPHTVISQPLARWRAKAGSVGRQALPELPEALNDRAQDNWELMLAIADEAGGAWPQKARQAALALSGVETEPSSLGEELLRDIWHVFAERAGDRIASADLVAALVEMTDRPWGEVRHGKPITQAWLARRLTPFGARPKDIRISGKVPKGYERTSFEDALKRYLPPDTLSQSATPLQCNEINGLDETQSATPENNVALSISANKLKSNDCSAVADENAKNEQKVAPSFRDRQNWRGGADEDFGAGSNSWRNES
jgi:putative DNA primase/helicase